MGKINLHKRLFVIVTLLALLLAGITSFSKSYGATNAFGACSPVGSFTQLNTISSGESGVANADKASRKWTVNELFNGSVAYSSFYGEGPSTWLYTEKEQRGKDRPGWTEDTQKAIENARGGMCVVAGGDGVPYSFMLIANGLTWLTGVIVMTLIGKDVMAETLAKIVGGDDTSGGLIETFVSSFYMPLVVLAAIVMATTLIYKGIIQRKFRESIGSILWSIGAFVFGLAFMLNPQLLASIPQKATSTITSCVMGAMSGQNCLSGDVEAPSVLSGKECISTVGGRGNSAENVVNSLNCTIWKAFVLEPWAEEQFGTPYNKLYTKDPPKGEKVWKGIPKDVKPEKYCVNLSSKKSFTDSVESGSPVMDGADGTICNVALYHLFVKTKMTDTVNQSGNNYNDKDVIVEEKGGHSYDSRWYDVIIPMANDESKWRNYSGNGMFFSRLGTSIMGLIAIIASSTVLLTLAVFGGAYKIIGLILMAFAPVFLLFAVEPTRGRKIFLGWLETLISSLLKYFAITVLIIVALVMYAGLLSNTSGIASLVGTIILTLAFHMYRKEIVDLIGASNMGGQKLSNKLNEVGDKAGKFAKNKGAAMTGGGFGGMVGASLARKDRNNARDKTIDDLRNKLSSATTNEEKDFYQDELDREEQARDAESGLIGTAIKGGFGGTNDALKRSFKRGDGLAARAFQQSDRTHNDIRVKNDKEQKQAQERVANFEKLSNIGNHFGEVDVEKTAKELERDVTINDIRESQREDVDYEGTLNEAEISALDDFADKLAKSATDEDLIEAANNPAVLNDPNKKNLVANEINARIRANSMVGISSNALSRTGLTDRTALSDDELALNVQMHKENYLETGSQAELDNYVSTQSEIARRNGVNFDSEADVAALTAHKEQIGDNHKRDTHIPREEDLEKLDEYKVKLPNGEFDSNSVTMPSSLKEEAEKNKDKIQKVEKLDEEIKLEKSRRDKDDEEKSKDNKSEDKGPSNKGDRGPLPKIEDEKPNESKGDEDPFGGPKQRSQQRNESEPQQRSQDPFNIPEEIDLNTYEKSTFQEDLDKELRRSQRSEVNSRVDLEGPDIVGDMLDELLDDDEKHGK